MLEQKRFSWDKNLKCVLTNRKQLSFCRAGGGSALWYTCLMIAGRPDNDMPLAGALLNDFAACICSTGTIVHTSSYRLHLSVHTHTHLAALFPGLPRWAGTRKVEPTAPRSRQITMPAPHHSVFYRPDALPAAQPTASKHWRHEHWRHSLTLGTEVITNMSSDFCVL